MTGPVFLFDRDGELNIFWSQDEAEDWMEAIDVEEGEYVAAYRQDGTRFSPATAAGRPVLTPTGQIDPEKLRERLQEYASRVPTAPQTADPQAFAHDWLTASRPGLLRRLFRREGG